MTNTSSRFLVAAVAVAAFGCNKVKAPGGIPSTPSVPSVPGGASGEVDPNTCGNYAAVDAGMKLKAFLQATKDLEVTTTETAKVVKQSCIMMGQELGMSEADLGGDDTGAICNHVIDTYKNNLKVTLKAQAGLHVKFVPGKCTVNASASASAVAGCSGSASAGSGGGGAEGQCHAAMQAEASIHAECTPPQFSVSADAKMVVDKSKLDMTIKAMQDGLPKLFDVAARIQPIKDAVAVWAATAKDLAAMGPKFAQSFGDQAMCIAGQIGAAANAATHIQANVSVSVSVSASASGSVGG
jgi:hypothetical protein